MADKPVPMAEPLIVRPKEAFRILGIGKTLGFELVRNGILERRPLGKRAIGITMASIKRVADGRAALPPSTPEPPKPRLKRPGS